MIFFGFGCFFFGICVGLTAPDIWDKLFNKPVVLREIPKEEAKEMIAEYIKNNEGRYTSDVIFDLALSVDLVLDCLRELQNEGIIVGEEQ